MHKHVKQVQTQCAMLKSYSYAFEIDNVLVPVTFGVVDEYCLPSDYANRIEIKIMTDGFWCQEKESHEESAFLKHIETLPMESADAIQIVCDRQTKHAVLLNVLSCIATSQHTFYSALKEDYRDGRISKLFIVSR